MLFIYRPKYEFGLVQLGNYGTMPANVKGNLKAFELLIFTFIVTLVKDLPPKQIDILCINQVN